MSASPIKFSHRPRELRRRVLLPARIRLDSRWSDACILNISSRGLMIQSARLGAEGSTMEIRRGDYVIIGQVVWREGARVGLQCFERVPVEEIMSLGGPQAVQLVAREGGLVERRKCRRAAAAESRLRGRALEFAAAVAIAVAFAAGAWSMASQALARPLSQVSSVLG